MKPEDHAWRALQTRASEQLRRGFADRVLRRAHGPQPAAWHALQAQGAARLRPGFAERILRAARQIPGVPSFGDQFALSLGTAAVCALAVFFFHARSARLETERNLATWQQIALQAETDDAAL
jgi:hypothetical protein